MEWKSPAPLRRTSLTARAIGDSFCGHDRGFCQSTTEAAGFSHRRRAADQSHAQRGHQGQFVARPPGARRRRAACGGRGRGLFGLAIQDGPAGRAGEPRYHGRILRHQGGRGSQERSIRHGQRIGLRGRPAGRRVQGQEPERRHHLLLRRELQRLMTDFFALLDEPRRPWLDPDRLKQKFLARSTEVHPDRVHSAPVSERSAASQRYAELNAAYNCLREPKDRLRHLLELERRAPLVDIQAVPPGLTDAFFQLGALCKRVDSFLAERSAVTSPLLKVGFFERAQEWTDQLMDAQRQLNGERDKLLTELQSLNAAWESVAETSVARPHLPLGRLEQIYRALGYLGRWSGQLQERIVQR